MTAVTCPSTKSILPAVDQRAHGVDRMGRGAEGVAAVDQRDAARDGMQVQHPVERGIAAADDHDAAVAEMLHLAHGIEDALVLVGVDARDRRLLRLERAAAGRDDHRLGLDRLVRRRCATRNSGRSARAERLEPLDHLAEMEGRAERMDLLHQVVDQLLAGDDRDSRECRRSASRDRARRTARPASAGCRSGGT